MNFLLFSSIFSILSIIYRIIPPKSKLFKIPNQWVHLSVEMLNVLFFFANCMALPVLEGWLLGAKPYQKASADWVVADWIHTVHATFSLSILCWVAWVPTCMIAAADTFNTLSIDSRALLAMKATTVDNV
jgi:hypothetical protein